MSLESTVALIAVVILCAVLLLAQAWRDRDYDVWRLDDRDYDDSPLWRTKR